jgi:hypothetical protein
MPPPDAEGLTWAEWVLEYWTGVPQPRPVKVLPDPHAFNIHYIDGHSGEAYDYSQYSDDVHDGDLLVAVQRDVVQVAVFCGAWPVLVGEHPGEPACYFHALNENLTFSTLENGRYLPAAYRAIEITVWLNVGRL